jgi:hypothetical protein
MLLGAVRTASPETGARRRSRAVPDYLTQLSRLTDEELRQRLGELRRQQRQKAVRERLLEPRVWPAPRAEERAAMGRLARELSVSGPRVEMLARDPGIGWRVDADSIDEARVALRLERSRRLHGMVRDPDPHGGDFIEDLGAGRVWDVKSFRAATFDLEASLRDVEEELHKGEDVIICPAHLSHAQAGALHRGVIAGGWSDRVIFGGL